MFDEIAVDSLVEQSFILRSNIVGCKKKRFKEREKEKEGYGDRKSVYTCLI